MFIFDKLQKKKFHVILDITGKNVRKGSLKCQVTKLLYCNTLQNHIISMQVPNMGNEYQKGN